jgi:hypothetical protein
MPPCPGSVPWLFLIIDLRERRTPNLTMALLVLEAATRGGYDLLTI